MKKIKTLFVPFVACSFLVACGGNGGGGGGGDDPVPPSFSVQESTVAYDDINKVATVKVDWTPSDHLLEFSKFSFKYGETTIESANIACDNDRPADVTINFSDDLTADVTGTLGFHYVDKTAKTDGNAEIKDICIKYIPPVHVSGDGGINLTYMRVNSGTNSEIGFTCKNEEQDINVYWGDGSPVSTYSSDNTYKHIYKNPGKYHIYITGSVDWIGLNDDDGEAIGDKNKYITNIILSNSVKGIQPKAFQTGVYTSMLQSVYIPSTVDSIADSAFDKDKLTVYCSEDKRSTNGWDPNCFPNTAVVTSGINLYMGDDDIVYCTYDSVGSNESYASVYICCNLDLKNAYIPSKITVETTNEPKEYLVKGIWESAFYAMDTLESVSIPGSVETIEKYAFVDCKNLKYVTLNEGLKTIKVSAFENVGIISITIPSTLDDLAQYALRLCNQLESVKFKETSSLKELQSYSIFDCPNIKNLKLAEGLETIDSYAIRKVSVTKIVLPSTIKKVNDYIIDDCQSIQEIDASAFTSIESIPEAHAYAFYHANPGNTVVIKIAKGLTEKDFIDRKWPKSTDMYDTRVIYENVQ